MAVASHRFASIRELLQGLGRELTVHTGSIAPLLPVWAEAVGPLAAKNCTPTALSGDVLVVQVSTRHWAEAMSAREAEVLRKLPNELGVKAIRWVGTESPR